ncbi:MAG: YfbR-like 5'-deoxynucleotidase [Hyphomicrobiaceae bacterium]
MSDAGLIAPPRAWQRMLSGRRLDLLAPDPNDIEITDIAHGLARVARWNGQTRGTHAFTVAQHSLVVTDICLDLEPGWPKQWRRAALLHDAAEYVIGDLISPFKTAIGDDYKTVENRLMTAIHCRFDLPEMLAPEIIRTIKTADRIAAYFEATVLAGFDVNEAARFFGTPETLSTAQQRGLMELAPVDTETAQKAYLERFELLG